MKLSKKLFYFIMRLIGSLHPKFQGWCEMSYLFNKEILKLNKIRAWHGAFLLKQGGGER